MDGAVSVRDISDKNDAAALQTALTAATQTGVALRIPGGTYIVDQPVMSYGKPVSIMGDGIGITRVVFTGEGGFDFRFDAQSPKGPPQSLHMRGLTIESRGHCEYAISAKWDRYQPNAQGSLWLSDMQITRADDGTGSFGSGIRLQNCFVGGLRDIIMVGDDAHESEVGLDLIDCTSIKVIGCDVNRYAVGVRGRAPGCAQQEGIDFTNCKFYDCDTGADFVSALELRFLGCHMNINGANASAAMRLHKVGQSYVSNCLLYAGGIAGNPDDQDGIVMSECNGLFVNNSHIISVGQKVGKVKPGEALSRTRTGIRSMGYNSYCRIEGNTVSSFVNGIDMAATDRNNSVQPNTYFGCGNNLVERWVGK